ncbi:MAG: tetratricopeptide repeat protein [Actinobacteria bacterium]|nr:MAG: tetratricopeptide repeat protein [Actinomycetota bacterium]
MTICAACGQENRAGARFCDSCGASLEPTGTRELRKVVTILFCDVTGSTALGERLDSESLRRVMERYFAVAQAVLERHGGTVEKFIGDAVMAVFGIPVVHEDDALRAARAAHELRDELAGLNYELHREFGTELQVRMGINTGEVVTNEGGTLATGDAVNVAARLEQAAQPGDILIGDATRQLAETALEFEPVPPVDAKGKSEPVLAHRLLGVRADAPAFERRFDAPFVGREGELEQLTQAYGRAVRDRSCQLFTVLGPAGIGKSRAVYEFIASTPDPIVLRGRCLAYGDGITYFPLVEILEQIAADRELGRLLADDPQGPKLLNEVSAAIGVADEAVVAREDTFRAVRMLLELLAQSRPLILVLDDLHWAEATFLDLVDHIADWSRDAGILLLCVARPELLDTRSGWGGGKLNATTILLEPLSESDSETLIDNLLAGGNLPEELRERITSSAEGNPLFVEQMLALIAQGAGNGNGEVTVPPTIQALLATRLEQLPAPERVAAERASVIGKEFWRNALAEIGGETSALAGLVRKELIRPHRSPIFPLDDAYRFRHQLIRDAAYDGMPKELRAELHERFGFWLQTNRSEYDEIVGYHLEQAFRLKEQLGRVDDAVRALGSRAGDLLGRAGHRAYERGDIPAAINLLSRATKLLPEGDARRLEHLVHLGNALHDAGELERAKSTYAEVSDAARSAGERVLELRAEIGRIHTEALTGQTAGAAAGLATVQKWVAELEELGDEAALAEAWYVAATFESWLGRSEVGGASYRRAADYARPAGNRRLATVAIGNGTLLQAWGSVYAPDGVRSCDELLAEYAGTSVEPPLRLARALHLSFMGDDEAARRDHERGVELYGQFGNGLLRAASSMSKADHALRAGRIDDAEAAARQGIEDLERLEERGFLSTTVGMLAEALCRQGRWDEAEVTTHRIAELAFPDDFDPQFRWRSIRARVLARRGEFEEAERLAREAVEIVDSTDWHLQRGEAAQAVGEVLELAGRTDEARAAYERAVESFERKGAAPDAEAVRRRLEVLP